MAQAASKWKSEQESNFDSVKPDNRELSKTETTGTTGSETKRSVTPIDRAWPGKSEPGHIRPIGPARPAGQTVPAGSEANERTKNRMRDMPE